MIWQQETAYRYVKVHTIVVLFIFAPWEVVAWTKPRDCKSEQNDLLELEFASYQTSETYGLVGSMSTGLE